MSASLDYGIEYRPITAPSRLFIPKIKESDSVKVRRDKRRQKTQARRIQYKENRKRRIEQFYRDFPNCYYCGKHLDKENRSLDHFVPRSRGGNSEFKNLVTACKECNRIKGDQLPSGTRQQARAWKLFPCY